MEICWGLADSTPGTLIPRHPTSPNAPDLQLSLALNLGNRYNRYILASPNSRFLEKEVAMNTRWPLAIALAALVAVGTTIAEEASKLEGVKCPVSGRAVKEASALDYKGGKVYFCCDNCPKGFEKDTKKFAAKANAQLVATGQAKQGGCPFTGGKVNPDTKIKVAGAEVGFCCEKCQGKASKLEGDAQVDAIFSDAAFTKGKFKVEAK
jgi:YHS domain-containing protein